MILVRQCSLSVVFFILSLCGIQAGADETDPGPDEAVVNIPLDEYSRGTPLRSAEGFLNAVDENDYEAAAEYLDLRNLRGEALNMSGAQLAQRFDVIIRRASWVDIDELIDHPDGRLNDGLPDYRESIGVVESGDEEVRLYLQKVPRGDGVSIWKISNATVTMIPQLYEAYGYSEVVEAFRRKVPEGSLWGFEYFKWVIFLSVAFLAYLLVLGIAWLIRLLSRNSASEAHKRLFYFLCVPFGLWVFVTVGASSATALGRGVTAETIHKYSPLQVLISVWVIFVGLGLLREVYAAHLVGKGRSGAVVLLNPIINGMKLVVVIAAMLFYLDQIGINISTVLAGLGVGGIAVALALQKPMEDVFGAITLYTQQPVKVGDFCQIGGETGTVEEIGLRTTRIRTLANTVIAIPNARLANEPITNISARNKILYRPILRLKYDTTSAQLNEILEGIRNLLNTHERVIDESGRVRFKEIADDALLIEVYAYLSTTEWSEYLQFAEELNVGILKVVADAGTKLSPPVQALQIEQGDSQASRFS